MRLNLRVKQTSEHARGTVATLDEHSCECFRRGWKVRGRDSIHSGEEGEKKVEQVRVIARSQGTLTGLEFLPRKRLEKVRKEGGGRDEFESRNKILIFVTISTEMRLELGGGEWATVGRKLELCLYTIMQREDRNAVGVKEGE